MEQTKLDRQHDAYERGILSIDEYEAGLARIRQQVSQKRTAKENLLSHSTLAAQNVTAINKLIACLKDFDAAWNAMQLDERKLILRSIIKQIRTGNGKVEIDFLF